MKFAMKLLVVLFGVLMLTTVTYPATPREQLKQMVEELQNNPTDTALREKVIKLAQKIKPAPAVPEEARRYLARGIAAFEIAKSPEEFKLALPEFQSAANVAPWWPDTYFNLAKVQEKTGDLKDAIASYSLYLTADPNAKDAESIRTQSYKLDFILEQKIKKDKAIAEQQARENEARAKEENAKKQKQAWAAEIVQWLRQNYSGREELYWNRSPNGNVTLLDGLGRRITYSLGGKDMDQILMKEPTFDNFSYCGTPASSDVRYVKWVICGSETSYAFNFTYAAQDRHPMIEITMDADNESKIKLEP